VVGRRSLAKTACRCNCRARGGGRGPGDASMDSGQVGSCRTWPGWIILRAASFICSRAKMETSSGKAVYTTGPNSQGPERQWFICLSLWLAAPNDGTWDGLTDPLGTKAFLPHLDLRGGCRRHVVSSPLSIKLLQALSPRAQDAALIFHPIRRLGL